MNAVLQSPTKEMNVMNSKMYWKWPADQIHSHFFKIKLLVTIKKNKKFT